MTFDVLRFRSKVVTPLRNNKFRLRIGGVPPGLRGTSSGRILGDAEFWCESVDSPAVSLMTGEVKTYGYGPSEKRPYAPIFEDCRIVMRIDTRSGILQAMKDWQGVAVGYEMPESIIDRTGRVGSGGPMGTSRTTATPYEVGYKEDFTTSVEIEAFSDDGKVSHRITMRDAWPLTVGPTSMAWEAMNDYARLPVTLSFSQVILETPSVS